MDMHAADQHPSGDSGKVFLQFPVALLVGEMLFVPLGEGMGRHGNGGETIFGGGIAHHGAKAYEFAASFSNRFANGGADFDLALQKFGADLTACLFRAFGHQGFRCRGQVICFDIDEKVFFLNSERETWFGHGSASFANSQTMPRDGRSVEG